MSILTNNPQFWCSRILNQSFQLNDDFLKIFISSSVPSALIFQWNFYQIQDNTNKANYVRHESVKQLKIYLQ